MVLTENGALGISGKSGCWAAHDAGMPSFKIGRAHV